ncbi:hypothetical protein [Allopusillimonas soli]|nr:hypothetical protein [Allopusillimonas soli]
MAQESPASGTVIRGVNDGSFEYEGILETATPLKKPGARHGQLVG